MTMSQNIHFIVYKYVVYFTAKNFYIESTAGIYRPIVGGLRNIHRIFQFGKDCLNGSACWCKIKVPGEDKRKVFLIDILDVFKDHLSRFLARLNTPVVEMGIKDKKGFFGDLVFEPDPLNIPVAYGIPSETGFVGSLAEPEHSCIKLLEPVSFIKDSHMLAFPLAVIAADTHMVESGHHGCKIIHLFR